MFVYTNFNSDFEYEAYLVEGSLEETQSAYKEYIEDVEKRTREETLQWWAGLR